MKWKGIYYSIGSTAGVISIVLLIYTIGFRLGGLTTTVNSLGEANIPQRLVSIESKTDLLWENYKTRTEILEKALIDQSLQLGKNPNCSSLPDTFYSMMKTNDIKKVLDSNLSRDDKAFNVIIKIGGLEELEKLMGIENSMKAIGRLILFIIEDYPSFSKP